MTRTWFVASILMLCGAIARSEAQEQKPSEQAWRVLPLVKNGMIDPAWKHLWGGGFSVMEDGSLRTDCTDEGMGLLWFSRERFGNCQLRVVFRSEHARCNAGVYV